MNQRRTQQKKAILNVMKGMNIHMTAEQVLHAVKKTNDNISLATVYRNLNAMCEEGLIQKVTGEGYHYYDGNPLPHDHFHCMACGKLIDIPCGYNDGKNDRISQKFGVRVIRRTVTYEGICDDCLKNEEENISWN